MITYPITLQVPGHLYEQLQRQAVEAKHSVEEEALTRLATTVPDEDQLPGVLTEALSALHLLDDEALWAAARNRLPQEISAQLEQLNHKQQREGLTDFEAQTLDQLAQQYELIMLTRAQAAVLLKERGYDISILRSRR